MVFPIPHANSGIGIGLSAGGRLWDNWQVRRGGLEMEPFHHPLAVAVVPQFFECLGRLRS